MGCGQAGSNVAKHGVSFDKAATVFADPLARTFGDPDQSVGEGGLLTFDVANRGRLLAWRTRNAGKRIISARKATPHERGIHEEG